MKHEIEGGAQVDRGFVIYDHPRDYPDCFVVREFSIIPDAGLVLFQPQPALLADSLEEARAGIPAGLVRAVRHVTDEPQIVETWL